MTAPVGEFYKHSSTQAFFVYLRKAYKYLCNDNIYKYKNEILKEISFFAC